MTKMKRLPLLPLLCALLFAPAASAQWSPAGNKIRSPWGEQLNPDRVLPEYPRPMMERSRWMNLNGLWSYALIEAGAPQPEPFEGEILVPFAIESALSGVGRRVSADQEILYQRTFDIPSSWRGERVLLHFGAVDWKADVWVNGIQVGSHTGGYTPFSFDITAALAHRGSNTLTVRVWDPTDKSYHPHGKQASKPEHIWYTPVSGIWQTVWLEPVPESHIASLAVEPDLDRMTLLVTASVEAPSPGDLLTAEVFDNGVKIASASSINSQPLAIRMPSDTRLWSPDDPYLYELKITLRNGDKPIDEVAGYAAMRKFSIARDADGLMRLCLNNRPLFQFGPLDQGWWPDGLYTAPSDEALQYDIIKTKELGFNMIRKHVKVEPARWYTHCDRLGIIVWQDMPNGDWGPEWQMFQYFDGAERVRSAESEACYRKEWREIIDALRSYPCIAAWVPFNESWGQFKSPEIAAWTKQYDPTRLVNPASGGNHYPCGDMLDIHHYPEPRMPLYDGNRATVVGEYGGIGRAIKGHLWEPDRNWGYVEFESAGEATDTYVKYAEMLRRLIASGISAGVYTQTTDVEGEVNGLMTYDRKVVKLDAERLREINRALCHALDDK